MVIDIFNHFMPKDYFDKLCGIAPDHMALKLFARLPALWDVDAHLRVMDGFGDYRQILSLSNPPIETLVGPDDSPALARFANDTLAALCKAYPDRFPGFIAALPMNNPDAAVAEAHRAIAELDARGVEVYTNVNGVPLSAPEYYPVFETVAGFDLPVWVHPMRGPNHSDYPGEAMSEAEIWFTFGWPYETSAAMARLLVSGIFDRLPDLTIISHHMGGMIPYFADKIELGFSQIFTGEPGHNPLKETFGLKREPAEYYRLLYGDTATNGSAAAAACGHAFFGTDRVLFASDAPFDPTGGDWLIGRCLAAVEALDISAAERTAILEGNARRLLRLP
ncbi:MAG: amidohydrolase family protein [Alphaproteobacteria bacterium]